MALDRQPRLLSPVTRSTRQDARVIVAEMGLLSRFAWLLPLAVACNDDPPFLSLGLLCDELAEDICDARAGCCPGVDPAACVAQEVERCKPELATLTAESQLRYDSTTAASRRRSARAQLDNCGAPPALASFFTDGLADGTACERSTQCSGGLCTMDTRVCAPAAPLLCAIPTP